MLSQRKKVYLAVAGSVGIHLAVLLSWACTIQWFPVAEAAPSQPPEEVKLQVVEEKPETPPPADPELLPNTPTPKPFVFRDTPQISPRQARPRKMPWFNPTGIPRPPANCPPPATSLSPRSRAGRCRASLSIPVRTRRATKERLPGRTSRKTCRRRCRKPLPTPPRPAATTASPFDPAADRCHRRRSARPGDGHAEVAACSPCRRRAQPLRPVVPTSHEHDGTAASHPRSRAGVATGPSRNGRMPPATSANMASAGRAPKRRRPAGTSPP